MAASYGQTASTIWGPRMIAWDQESDAIEISVNSLPRPLQREFNHVFDERTIELDKIAPEDAEVLAIPTNQKALQDLVAVGEHIELEKDRLLNVFIGFARDMCRRIRDLGYWADFIDPCSGLPMLTRNCNKVYSEVDGMECCLGYKAHNAGFCKVLLHPVWGSAVYPATIFCYAPRAAVLNLVQEYSADAS